MDSSQQETVLRAIALSSSATLAGRPISHQDRQSAFAILSDFKKYDKRVPISLTWLQQEHHQLGEVDISIQTKMFAFEILQGFLQTSYNKLAEQDRLAIRQAVLASARQQARLPSSHVEGRILGNKTASVLAALIIREFPQRWTTLMDDLFLPVQQGGLWYNFNNPEELANGMGVKICLESLKLVAEDCTDSDFNAKISTTRRNDILIGFNEVSSRFLPLLFRLLEHITFITQSKESLHQMRTYLLSNQQRLSTMTVEQATAYQAESDKLTQSSQVVADTLVTFEKFCRSMPMEWIISPQQDLSAAFLHLMREPEAGINLLAVECLERLCLRGKFDFSQWMRLVQELPGAVSQANQQFAKEQEYAAVTASVSQRPNPLSDPLPVQLAYHRSLSRMLATVVSSHICHLTMDKKILQSTTPESANFSNYLRFLVEMLKHPSGRVCGEQVNMWVGLLRDPQITRGNLLNPFIPDILTCYLSLMIRIRWEDVDEQTHSQASLMEASWDDEEEYDAWINDMRSRSSQLFKFLGNAAPHLVCSALNARIQSLVASYGNGEPRDHLDPSNQQLTLNSEAVRQFEGTVQPVENILHGVPSWALETGPLQVNDKQNNREEIKAIASNAMNEMVQTILQWNPAYLWLKFRRAQLLETLKHFWQHDPTTLLRGIQVFMDYLRAPDEWGSPQVESDGSRRMSGEIVSLRKKSSSALVSVAKCVPNHLVPWLSQLSEATKSLLSLPSHDLIPTNRMHLYEFLSCVATAVDDPLQRSTFVANVLSDAIGTLESAEVQEAISSAAAFMDSLGIAGAAQSPSSVTNAPNVRNVIGRFQRFFSAYNQLLSVGKRCYEAAQKRPNGGIPLHAFPMALDSNLQNFPDEGPVSIRDLSVEDPFVPLWPRILPNILRVVDTVFRMLRPENQSTLLKDRIQRYSLAISDDEAFLSKKNDGKTGGVFGEGGTAGSVIPGVDRRDLNLAPRWSSWLQELRNSSFQLLGLVASQRALFAPEMSEIFPQFVSVVADPEFLLSMEHRHFTQYMKQFIEVLLLSCPSTMYMSHVAPILAPVLEHAQYRFTQSWAPVLDLGSTSLAKPLFTADAEAAAALASRGGEGWYTSFYTRSGLFVGDLDAVTAEAAVEKHRVEMCRIYSDVIQTALALKGDWALVLANQAKEESGNRNKSGQGPKSQIASDGLVNADGTPKLLNQAAIDARKLARISAMCHFLFLEHEQIAGSLCMTIIDCLSYPDAYTCRRITRICHRMLETTAWSPRYIELLGNRMLSVVVKNLVTEPKWMVGVEWDMINVARDVYCRLVLGQIVQPGGQGAGLQQPAASDNPINYEQTKTVDSPLQGGGILTSPSDIPRRLMASLPGVDVAMVNTLEDDLKRKRSAKGQKDVIRDFLRVVSDNMQDGGENGSSAGAALGSFDRAVHEESLLHNSHKKSVIEDIPEKLVTHSMLMKQAKSKSEREEGEAGLAAFKLF